MPRKITEEEVRKTLFHKFNLQENDIEKIISYNKIFWGSPNVIIKHLEYLRDNATVLCDNLVDRFLMIKNLKKGVSLYNLKLKHGDILGQIKYDSYRNKQSIKNTYEHKKIKYNWNEEQFKKYNQSRAVTKENCVRRHGDIKGEEIYKSYCEKQKHAGCSLDYFIEKYGKQTGEEKYIEVNNKKGHNLQNYIERFGEDGVSKFEEYISNHSVTGYSKSSQKFFDALYEKYYNGKECHIYYAKFNKEFGIMDISTGTYRKYDFVDIDKKVIIEYNGDYFHANPKIYRPEDLISFPGSIKKTAKQIWLEDEEKYNLARKRNYIVVYVWESDCIDNMDMVLDRCITFMDGITNDNC